MVTCLDHGPNDRVWWREKVTGFDFRGELHRLLYYFTWHGECSGNKHCYSLFTTLASFRTMVLAYRAVTVTTPSSKPWSNLMLWCHPPLPRWNWLHCHSKELVSNSSRSQLFSGMNSQLFRRLLSTLRLHFLHNSYLKKALDACTAALSECF